MQNGTIGYRFGQCKVIVIGKTQDGLLIVQDEDGFQDILHPCHIKAKRG